MKDSLALGGAGSWQSVRGLWRRESLVRAQKYSQGLYSSQLLPSREPQRRREGRGSRALVHPSAVCDQVKDAVLQVEKLGPGGPNQLRWRQRWHQSQDCATQCLLQEAWEAFSHIG